MKKILLFIAVACSVNAFAQPILTSGSNVPLPGSSFQILGALAISGTGGPGANQTWDFSNNSFSILDTLIVINPSASPFASTYPSATYSYTFASTYTYLQASAGKMEALAYGITAPGSGNDFSPNPRTLTPFPFNFSDIATDTWQAVGGNTNNVTLTYDGYGTLITPAGTYSNVVRIKEDYGNNAIDYQWYQLNPFMNILAYSNNQNFLYHSKAIGVTGVAETISLGMTVNVYPIPAGKSINFELPGFLEASSTQLNIYELTGKLVKNVHINSKNTIVNVEVIEPGIYFYSIQTGTEITKGKIIIE